MSSKTKRAPRTQQASAFTGKKTAMALAVGGALSIGGGGAALAQQDQALEEIVVTGIRGSLTQALDLKRDATGVVDAIVQEDIGKFPDLNLAESLQRITGVSIDRDGGEGQAVSVRGFGPQFNTVLVNGRQIATDSGGREFNFDVLTAEFISAATVSKSGRADLQDGGIGSTINISTARPLDNPGFQVTGSIKGVHETLSEETVPGYSVLVSNTFADDRMGVLFSYSSEERDVQRNRIGTAGWRPGQKVTLGADNPATDDDERYQLFSGYIPRNWDQEVELQERTRTNANLVLQFAPSDNVTITLDGYVSTFEVESDVADLASWFEPDRVAPTEAIVEDIRTNMDWNGKGKTWKEVQRDVATALRDRAQTNIDDAVTMNDDKPDAFRSGGETRAQRQALTEAQKALDDFDKNYDKIFGMDGMDHPISLFVPVGAGAATTLLGINQSQNVYGAGSVPATDYVSHTRNYRNVTNEGFALNVEWDFTPNLTGIFDWSTTTAEDDAAGDTRFNVIGQENNYTLDARGSTPTVRHVGYGAGTLPPDDESRTETDAFGNSVTISEARLHYNERGSAPTNKDEINEIKFDFVFAPDSGPLQEFKFGLYTQEREKSRFQIFGGVCPPCGYTRPAPAAAVGLRPYEAGNYFSGLIDTFYSFDGEANLAYIADPAAAEAHLNLISGKDMEGNFNGTADTRRTAMETTIRNAFIDRLQADDKSLTTAQAEAMVATGMVSFDNNKDRVGVDDPEHEDYVPWQERQGTAVLQTEVNNALAAQVTGWTVLNPTLQGNRYTVNEEILSLYGDATLAFDVGDVPVTVNFGFRYADTRTDTDAIQAPLTDVVPTTDETLFMNQFGNEMGITRGRSYSNVLHNLSVKLDLTEDWVFRFANYDSLTRPTLDQLSPATTFQEPRLGNLNARGGNPELKPFLAENWDLSLEWYYGDANALSFTYFFKDVDDFIVNLSEPERYELTSREGPDFFCTDPDLCTAARASGVPELNGQFETYLVSRPRNGESAEVKGFELAWTHVFDIGLGFSANFTVVDSDVALTADPTERFALEGLGDSQNYVIFWEGERWHVRAAYNNRDDFLRCIDNACLSNNPSNEPVYGEAYGQWDLSAGFDITENFTLFFEGINITEEEQVQTGRFANQIFSIEDNGARYIFGVRGSLGGN